MLSFLNFHSFIWFFLHQSSPHLSHSCSRNKLTFLRVSPPPHHKLFNALWVSFAFFFFFKYIKFWLHVSFAYVVHTIKLQGFQPKWRSTCAEVTVSFPLLLKIQHFPDAQSQQVDNHSLGEFISPDLFPVVGCCQTGCLCPQNTTWSSLGLRNEENLLPLSKNCYKWH